MNVPDVEPLLRPNTQWCHRLRGDVALAETVCTRLLQRGGGAWTLSAGRMTTQARLFDEIAQTLRFPSYFGRNWDALDECLHDLDWLRAPSYALIITDAERLLRDEPPRALAVLLSILARAARTWRLPGSDGESLFDPVPRAFHVVLHVQARNARRLDARWPTSRRPPHEMASARL